MSLEKANESVLAGIRARNIADGVNKLAKNMSEHAKTIVRNHYGFRSEFLYGEGFINFDEVLDHETIEFCNTDIYETMESLYELHMPCGTEPEEEEECEKNNAVVLAFVKEKLRTDTVYCKWLCAAKQDVTDSYEEAEEDISKWNISGKFMIVSDMGRNGMLVASDKMIEEM